MADILAEIIAHKRHEVASAKAAVPLDELQRRAASAPPARSLLTALSGGRGPRIIAECKRQSPSRGLLVQDYDPVRLAQAYVAGGAAAISVLTDEHYFGGHLTHLTRVRAVAPVPVLRKDFVVDAYQVHEARAAGADSFLLLAGPLDSRELEELIGLGRSLGMEPLIESHSPEEVEVAMATSGRIFGINNRNLKTFAVDLETSRALVRRLARREPAPVLVCESGIRSRADVDEMVAIGYQAFLVGEALVTHDDPRRALDALLTP